MRPRALKMGAAVALVVTLGLTTYYLRVVRGIVLKGVGLESLWSSLLPLAVFGAVVFTLSVLRFRKQLD